MAIGPTSSQVSYYEPLQLDVSLLSGYYNARTTLRVGASPFDPVPQAQRGPAIITPWDQPEDERPLERRVNEIRNGGAFINPKSDAAKLAGDNKDAKALFTLYQAVLKLKAIADYAVTKPSERGVLDILAQKGLAELRDYIAGAELDKLDLIYGAKSNRVETTIGLGRNDTKVVGQVVQKQGRDDPIPGLNGDEVFTITLTKSGESDSFEVDLAEISGPITLNSLASHVNAKIAALQVVDATGELVPKYTTRMVSEQVAGKGFALAFSGLTGETVNLSAAVAEPSLFLVGTAKGAGANAQTTATLSRFDDILGTDPTRAYQQNFSGVGTTLKEVAKTEQAADLLNGRTNPGVEKIRAQLADFYKESGIEKTAESVARPAVETTASAVAVDSEGHVFVIGTTVGDLGREVNRSDGGDVYLTKYDAAGNAVWQRLLGASGSAEGFALTIDGNDNVIVAGVIDGSLGGKELYAGKDSFVTKYANNGDQLWTQKFDTFGSDAALAVTVDVNNDVYIAGYTEGAIARGLVAGGGRDAYVARLDGANGAVAAIDQFGGAGTESARAIAIADDGNILVAVEEDGRAVLRKLDQNDFSNVLWSVDLGSLDGGAVTAIAVEGGSVYLAGHTGNAAFGGGAAAGHGGAQDGFVVRIDDSGGAAATAWTSFVGGDAGDYISDLAVSGGQVYVAGKTASELGANPKSGTTEGFVAKIDGVDGSQTWLEQIYGAGGQAGVTGLAFSHNGSSVLTKIGFGPGTIQTTESRDVLTQTTVRAGDYFYISINGKAKQKVTIEAGDTYEKIAARINRLSLSYIKAEAAFGGDGRMLRISVKNGSEIQIFAGDGDKDALKSLGLAPTKIMPTEKLYALDEPAKKKKPTAPTVGGVFGFKFEDGLSLGTEAAAKYFAGKLGDVLAEIQRAYRALNPDPLVEMLKQQATLASGPIPPALAKQLANYQNGLSRLLAGGGMMA